MTVSARLLAIAGLVKPGARLADVGTDHGYLPVWLIREGIIPSAVATDLRRGPLSAAKRSAQAHGVEDRIDFRLTNGLDAVSPEEVDTVVIAGMGGETIAHIIKSTPWLSEGGHDLIIQPQSKLPELTGWLFDLGYTATDQLLVADGGVIYTIYKVAPGGERRPEGAERYIHPALAQRRDALLPRYLDGLCRRLRRALDGLEQAGGGAWEKRADVERDLGALEKLRGERI